MKEKTNGLLSALVTAAGLGILIAFAATSVKAAEAPEQQGLVDEARITFEKFMRDKDLSWLHENLYRAKGVLIVPSLLKGGFIFGGSGGSGVLVVRDQSRGDWTQPGFYTIGSVTFGLQIGGEAAQVVMMVMSQSALEKLYTSSFKLGGDTSIAAGPVGAGAKANIKADMISFGRAKGAYAGVSLEGAVIAARTKWNKAYYGREARPVDIFVRRSVSNPGSAELRRALERATKAKKKSSMSKAGGNYHEVRSGDTLYGIAKRYGVTVEQLRDLNRMEKDDKIYVGQKILLPPGP
ncbi:MAG: LysM peptidoglycan-binding domain-containing protein [Deltaproteobacteria bacterium]|nr:LysM peptidoglycan-binding domain-containing protein [Deltaproteobacteria bacterium]